MTLTQTTPNANIAIIQLRAASPAAKLETIARVRELVAQAVGQSHAAGAPVDLVILPELWNGLADPDESITHDEVIPEVGARVGDIPAKSVSVRALAEIAAQHNIWLVGGTIVETGTPKLYNTATVWSPAGELVQKHRKAHLFDIALPAVTFKESAAFDPGQSLCTFQTPWGKFGLAICYELRFAEVAIALARQDISAIIYPAAFTKPTGELHWELLHRARALDNQVYVFAACLGRVEPAKVVMYGHSLAANPLGQIVATAAEGEEIVYATLDHDVVKDTRAGIPLGTQRRFDLYADIGVGAVISAA
ncbi:Omega-amidase NIT3 [Vanrija pseudolonga]|uniref:Omega-amidase NIT3 n=1 Tax=Vanrija pseudolonga TaxID=143232 RepID=A0AAF1BM88_9TREE|nr:Omega-amidase NIT3 [Vanrija pseudolonga]